MIIKSGKHICERCGTEYEWVVRQLESGEAAFGRIEDINGKNIRNFDPKSGFVTRKCSNCGASSMSNLLEK